MGSPPHSALRETAGAFFIKAHDAPLFYAATSGGRREKKRQYFMRGFALAMGAEF